MGNLFLLAATFGVELKQKDIDILNDNVKEETFKEYFNIPKFVEKTYRKHKTFKVENLLGFVVASDTLTASKILSIEIQHLTNLKSNALGYGKKARANEIQEKIDVLTGKLEAFNNMTFVKNEDLIGDEAFIFTLEQLKQSGLHTKSRKYFILASQHQTPEEIIKENPALEKYEIYVPIKEYLELIKLNSGYYKTQLEAAKKTLKNKL